MRNLSDRTPDPFHIRFAPTALKQVQALSAERRHLLSERLLQLADLASFAVGYSLNLSSVESLVADMDGLSIRYQVNEVSRTLTLLEIGEAAGERTVRRING